MSALSSYEWPGNIRELQKLIERAVILSNHGVFSNPLPAAGPQTGAIYPAENALRDSERVLCTTLICKMQKLAISRPGLQSSPDLMEPAQQEPASLPQSQ